MESVALTTSQLNELVENDPRLKLMYYGTLACDEMPKRPEKKQTPSLHCQHRPKRPAWTTLDCPIDSQKCVRNHGQLRFAFGPLRCPPFEKVGGDTLEVHRYQWKISSSRPYSKL